MKNDLKTKTTELRRQHILEAAARVFAKRGFRSASIRDVAQAAGVADGTIYNVFSNKSELLLSLLDPLAEHMPPADAPAPADAITFATKLLLERWETFTPQMLGILRVVLSEVLVDPDLRTQFFSRVMVPAVKPLEQQIATLAEAKIIAAPHAGITSRAMTAMFLGLIMLRLLGDDELESRGTEEVREVAKLLVEGLRPREQSQ